MLRRPLAALLTLQLHGFRSVHTDVTIDNRHVIDPMLDRRLLLQGSFGVPLLVKAGFCNELNIVWKFARLEGMPKPPCWPSRRAYYPLRVRDAKSTQRPIGLALSKTSTIASQFNESLAALPSVFCLSAPT